MPELMFKVKAEANIEVRDADGKLISSSPIEDEVIVSESVLRARGIPYDPERAVNFTPEEM